MTGTLVVIPAHCEQATIAGVVAAVRAAGFACVVVDDGSTDDTADRARQAGAQVISLISNGGVGAALAVGFRHAIDTGYQAVVQCDADGQHPVAAIPSLVVAARTTGAHLVVGSRLLGAGPSMAWHRRVVARALSRLVRVAGGPPVRDTSSGFRYIGAPLLELFAAEYPTRFLADTVEVLAAVGRAGYRVHEVPVAMAARIAGQPARRGVRASWPVMRVGAALIAMRVLGRGYRLPSAPVG